MAETLDAIGLRHGTDKASTSNDTPWYPSLRQFRQDATRDWAPVIARIAATLRDYARNLE